MLYNQNCEFPKHAHQFGWLRRFLWVRSGVHNLGQSLWNNLDKIKLTKQSIHNAKVWRYKPGQMWNYPISPGLVRLWRPRHCWGASLQCCWTSYTHEARSLRTLEEEHLVSSGQLNSFLKCRSNWIGSFIMPDQWSYN